MDFCSVDEYKGRYSLDAKRRGRNGEALLTQCGGMTRDGHKGDKV